MNRRAFTDMYVIINRRVGGASHGKFFAVRRRYVNLLELVQVSIGGGVADYADTVLEAVPPAVIGKRHNQSRQNTFVQEQSER